MKLCRSSFFVFLLALRLLRPLIVPQVTLAFEKWEKKGDIILWVYPAQWTYQPKVVSVADQTANQEHSIGLKDMNPGGYTVEVTSLSPIATEKDVYDFFAFSGTIEHVEIVRYGECACTAYVTFKDAHSLQTAVLLSGATIVDQRVCITSWGQYEDEFDIWNRPSWKLEDETCSTPSQRNQFGSNTGGAVTMAQEVVRTMLAKGYVLGKDALSQAKAFDESHQVSATAAAKVSELSQRIGLTDKISAGVETLKSVDEMYHVLETTKSAISATGRTAVAAANTVVNSSYFSNGALWVSDALSRAAKAAADLGSHGVNK